MTILPDSEHNAQMESMCSIDKEMPSIGIFWYDQDEHSFWE